MLMTGSAYTLPSELVVDVNGGLPWDFPYPLPPQIRHQFLSEAEAGVGYHTVLLRGLLSRVSVSLDGRSSAIVGGWGRWPAHKESQTGLNNQR